MWSFSSKLNLWENVCLLKYLVDQCGVVVFKREQSEWAGVGEGLVERPWFSVHKSQSWVCHMMLRQIWEWQSVCLECNNTLLTRATEAYGGEFIIGLFFSLTSGAAQRGGHSFVHDEQRTVQPGALHGHLDLLDAGVQSSLPGLLSGEDGVTLTAYLSQRWTLSCHSGCKACGWAGWMERRT